MTKLIVGSCCCLMAAWASATGLDGVTYRIHYANGTEEVRCGVAERCLDGAFRARFRTIDMSDDMVSIDILSDAGVVRKCDGYWTLGDCRYGKFDRDSVTTPTTTEEFARMQFLGVKTPDRCFVAIVKGMPLETTQYVSVTNGTYEVFVRYNLKRIEFYPYDDAVVDFYPLDGNDANYSGMARKYRAYQIAEQGCRPLKERVKGNPALDFASKSIFLRCKFGRCDRRTSTVKDWINLKSVSL